MDTARAPHDHERRAGAPATALLRRSTAAALCSLLLAGSALLAPAGPAAAAPETPAAPAGSARVPADDVDAWLDGVVPALLDREGVAGAVVSVVSSGGVVTQRGFGAADLGGGGAAAVPVDPEQTLFRIGSVSKLVTATAVVRLVEDGVLDLDEPVQDHLDFTLPTRFPEPVTLRHLLSHTAGFEDQIAGVIMAPGSTPPALRDVVSADPPEQIAAPGTVPAYSNYSNALAAYVVQRVTGQEFTAWATDSVLRASGMTSATYEQPLPADLAGRMSKGYGSTAGDEVPFEVVGPAPAGAVSATAADMSAFMLAQLQHDTGSGPLLPPEGFELLHAPALGPDQLGGLAAGPRMALGWFDQSRNGHRILGHAGDLTAFHAHLQLYPDDDTGIFVALNSSGVRGDSSTALREQLLDGFGDRYFPDEREPAAASATSAEHSAEAEGTYLVSRRSQSTFARLFFLLSAIDVRAGEEGVLTVSAVTDPSGAPVPFVEVEPWVWQEVVGQRRMAVDHDGAVVTAIGLDPAFTLLPMPAHQAALRPVLGSSLAVLALWPLLGALVAVVVWRHRVRPERTRTDRRLRAAGAAGAVALAGAGVLWAVVASALLNDAAPPHAATIHAAQVLTALAALGVVPAAWSALRSARRATTPGHRREWLDVVLRAAVAAAFAGWGWVAVVGGLLSVSTSY